MTVRHVVFASELRRPTAFKKTLTRMVLHSHSGQRLIEITWAP